jgi:hypothetical protein
MADGDALEDEAVVVELFHKVVSDSAANSK